MYTRTDLEYRPLQTKRKLFDVLQKGSVECSNSMSIYLLCLSRCNRKCGDCLHETMWGLLTMVHSNARLQGLFAAQAMDDLLLLFQSSSNDQTLSSREAACSIHENCSSNFIRFTQSLVRDRFYQSRKSLSIRNHSSITNHSWSDIVHGDVVFCEGRRKVLHHSHNSACWWSAET